MTDLDKMARSLLAAEYDRAGSKRFAEDLRSDCHIGDRDIAHAVGAVRAALLTAPPGYALVPVDELQRAIDVLRYGAHPQPSPHADALAAMIAAAPEVKP